MALATSFDDAKANQIRRKGDGKNTTGASTQTMFFGSRDHPDLPYAKLTRRDSDRASRAHFHLRDQFQLFIDGKGKVGRHDLIPYCVHFSRAYTPYGPFLSDTGGLTFFVLRRHPDPGSQRLPEKKGELKRIPDRRPWQITRQINFTGLQSGLAADTDLQAVPDINDEHGLAAYTLSMKPNAKARAPDPSSGDGQYLVVVKGTLLHDNRELKAPALVFVYPKEEPYQVHAGPEGLEAIVLNFPRGQSRPAGADKSAQTTAGFKKWQCTLCSFAYDEAAGMPADGIAPGTRWQDVPETWTCPDCSSSKADFAMIESADSDRMQNN